MRIINRRKLEAEERARANALKSRMDQLQAFSSSYEKKVGMQLQQQTKNEQEKTMRSLEEKERQDAERDRLKEERRKQQVKYDQDYNIRMMEEKRLIKEREKLQGLELRLRIEQDARDAKRKEEEIAEERRRKLELAKVDLDHQMITRLENKRKDKKGYVDDDEAKKQEILRRLEEDPSLRNKVMEKVSMYGYVNNGNNGPAGASRQGAYPKTSIF